LRGLRGSPFAARVTKYALGSVIALSTSVIVFAMLYWLGQHNTAIDSVAAFVAGAVPNWILNRRWAWGVRGSVNWAREIVGYVVVSLIALLASSIGTAWVQSWVTDRGGFLYVAPGTGLRIVLVTGAYVAVQAILFAAKFVVYEHWVFAGRSRLRAALRSRHQVWVAARANRTP
jgi:putative flippase GtrA